MKPMRRSGKYSPGSDGDPDAAAFERLLKRTVRTNAVLLGLVMATGLGLALFVGTHISLAVTGERAGQYLNLLSVFLPGYSASPGGAWFGLLWGFVIGGVSGSYVYLVYARSLGLRLTEMMARDEMPEDLFEHAVLRISGHGLGLALGSLMALQLFLTTNWLVIRGTADESRHAVLLGNYFPGYSVSFIGSLIGAAEIFAVTYILSLVLSQIYNWIVARRHRRSAP